MAPSPLSPQHKQALSQAVQAVADAEAALQQLRSLGISGCTCNGPVEVGKYRCRKNDDGTISCHRCVGNEEWYDTGLPCQNSPICGQCSG